jgi:3-methyladenine DNA glycosylase AlkC
MRHISTIMGKYLPSEYEAALKILYEIEAYCSGFPYLIFPDFVEVFGQAPEHWELSMAALERFTQHSSAEFAIRPFLLKDPERGMKQMAIWSKHENLHVRRLACEGCRPRLPWGVSLAIFKKDPGAVLSVLEQLKEDSSLYVRKSVANNLNDITKDNAEAVLEAATRWIGKNPFTDWILRQGLRTLIRKGNPVALAFFGYAANANELAVNASIMITPADIKIGETCELTYELGLKKGESLHLRIEYGIDFVKANGTTSRKIFLLSDKTVNGGSVLKGKKPCSFSDLSTRRHYPGLHRIVLLVNGQETADTKLKLLSK